MSNNMGHAQHEPLKPREVEIVTLMAEGLTNREIADRLFLGVETVRWYAKQLYTKLEVSGREEAVERAREIGLLEASPEKTDTRQNNKQNNLPIQLTPFIGREHEINEVVQLLSTTRLLTLTGPGGTGKTRLSLAVAAKTADSWSGGVYFVDLSPLMDPALIGKAIANALNVRENPGEPIISTLTRAIGDRQILLIIDNIEHVVSGAIVLSKLLVAAPNLKILATSRETLHISGEHVFPVPPLSLPDQEHTSDFKSLSDSAAIALFVQRAKAVQSNFRLTAENGPIIAEICTRLDGLPLAIELAAARSRLLTPQAILERMGQQFMTLTAGARDVPERQRTLKNAIDWSYYLLDENEQHLFRCLSVFRKGLSLSGVEIVCAEGLTIDFFDGLSSLLDKSLILQLDTPLEEPRFGLLNTLQSYAIEKLEESGEEDEIRRRHANYFADLAEAAAPELRLARQQYWFQLLEIERYNLRAALQWTLNNNDPIAGLHMIADLRDYWFYQGYHTEGLDWFEQALPYMDSAPENLQGRVYLTASFMSYARQETAKEKEYSSLAMDLFDRTNDRINIAWTLTYLAGASEGKQIEYEDAIKQIELALSIFRELNDKPGIAQSLNSLGEIARLHGETERAKRAYQESLKVARETGEKRREAIMFGNLGAIAVDEQNFDQAEVFFRQGLEACLALGFSYMIPAALSESAGPLIARNAFTEAVTLLGASAAILKALGVMPQPSNQVNIDRYLAILPNQLQPDDFGNAWKIGQGMSEEEAVVYALSILES